MDNTDINAATPDLNLDSNPFQLTVSQSLLVENFRRELEHTDPEWVRALAVDLFRQTFIHRNLFAAHLKGDF